MIAKKMTILIFKSDMKSVQDAIDKTPFQECTASQSVSTGFVPVGVESKDLYKIFQNLLTFQYRIDSKSVPGSAVKSEFNKRQDLFRKNNGRKMAKAEKIELKELIHKEMLSRAIPSVYQMSGWFDFKQELLVLQETSVGKVDQFISEILRRCIEISIQRIQTIQPPEQILTQWVHDNSEPDGLTIDDSAKLEFREGGKANLTNLDIKDSRVIDLLGMGGECVELAMTMDDKTSFVVSKSMDFKKIKHLDQDNSGNKDMDEEARLQAEMFLNAETSRLLSHRFINLFGGIRPS